MPKKSTKANLRLQMPKESTKAQPAIKGDCKCLEHKSPIWDTRRLQMPRVQKPNLRYKEITHECQCRADLTPYPFKCAPLQITF